MFHVCRDTRIIKSFQRYYIHDKEKYARATCGIIIKSCYFII